MIELLNFITFLERLFVLHYIFWNDILYYITFFGTTLNFEL